MSKHRQMKQQHKEQQHHLLLQEHQNVGGSKSSGVVVSNDTSYDNMMLGAISEGGGLYGAVYGAAFWLSPSVPRHVAKLHGWVSGGLRGWGEG